MYVSGIEFEKLENYTNNGAYKSDCGLTLNLLTEYSDDICYLYYNTIDMRMKCYYWPIYVGINICNYTSPISYYAYTLIIEILDSFSIQWTSPK